MRTYQRLDHETEMTAREIVDAAYMVHRELGPGLLESTYEKSMAYELRSRGLNVETQLSIPVQYKELFIPYGYRLDMLVESRVIVEVKAVEQLMSIHTAQTLTYLRMLGKRLGLLVNFNVPLVKNGMKRVIL
ncbi:MAG: GxxExxY protein [Bacteroidetes bacterium]|nr:GxxExxY protein [Bacteroidota bacterium]